VNARTRKLLERTLSIATPIVVLLLWEAASRFDWIDSRFFPPPSEVIVGLVQMFFEPTFWAAVGATMARVVAGFFVGAIPGVLVGLAIGLNPWVRAALNPLVGSTYPVPKTALLPLLLLIFGIGEWSKVLFIAIAVFYPVLINTVTGVLQIRQIYFDVGDNFKADRWRFVRTIAIPGALPTILAGLRLGAGLALIFVYVGEISAGGNTGLGFLMWEAWGIFDVQTMYAGLLMLAIIGYLINLLFDGFDRWLVPWRVKK